MDLQDGALERSPLNQVEAEIKEIIEGDTQTHLKVINDTSAETFYTSLEEDLKSAEFDEYKPKVQFFPLGELQFKKVVSDMYIGNAEYNPDTTKGMLIDTNLATIGVVALNLSGNRISLLLKCVSSTELEDFRKLRQSPYAHRTLGS